MFTIGIDFAAQPANTAVARVEWIVGRAHVRAITHPATDARIVQALDGATAVGIDVPFGWPDSFVHFVAAHRDDVQATASDDPDEWRRNLAYRMTDRVVAAAIGKQPLSVATDRIGLAAMRASSLLAAIRESGEHVDRAGGSRIAEVYPAAALKHWGLRYSGYKGANLSNRNELVDALLMAAPWLEFGEFESACRRNDDLLDAVVAALVARAHALGHWHRPAADEQAQAAREGWMIIPTCSLAALPLER